jgi:glycosyltransferase involved in cell wall biosynthesis
MRILHVLAPAPYGGLERVVTELTAGLAARGHDVHVAAAVEGDAAAHPFLRGLRVQAHPVDAPGRAWLREAAAVDALRRRLRPDVVHTHGYRADVLHGRRGAGPVASTVHGFTGGGARNRVYEALQRLALRRFDAVVAVSAPLAERLRAAVPSRRVHTIPNAWCGAPVLSREEARARLGLPADAWVVGWVGRLSPEKGPDLLLDALARVSGLPWTASVLGDGPRAGALRIRARGLRIADRVRWHGAVAGAAALYPAFDLFVLSSRTEGTPMALLEAVAAGVPVVAAAVGGVPHVLDPAQALLVPPENPAALAAAIAAVHAGPAAAADRARAAHARLGTAFAPGRWIGAYESLYAALAALPRDAAERSLPLPGPDGPRGGDGGPAVLPPSPACP